jgi:hypothetical protein
MQHNYGCGTYRFTIGGDDGVRLTIDGTVVIDLYYNHSYLTGSADYFLTAGNHNFVIEFFENTGQSRVSYTTAYVNDATGGIIGNSQNLCQSPIDPAAFTSTQAAIFCSGATPVYQWQQSPNGTSGWTDIGGATAVTYDPPSGFPTGTTRYYRRRATGDGGATFYYSNNVSVTGTATQGDQTTYGSNSWIGYVYDGASNNFSTNYRGYMTEATTFDESFCGDNCSYALNGCDIVTETFTVRFKMAFTPASSAGYTFTVGADDGYRLSINGGSTWLINNYNDHGYVTTTSAKINLYAGSTYNFILEYYENGGGNRVTFNYVTGTLPVTWSYLNGFNDKNVNVLEWRTATETNNDGFDVERSLDGKTFSSIGWVDGQHTTQVEQQYSFTDAAPSAGWNYYRLKQLDLDGKFNFSQLIPVSVSESLSLYPNPAQNHIYVSGLDFRNPVDVTITDLVTHRSYSLRQDALQPSRFLINNIVPGLYSCHVSNGEQTFTQKIIIQ